MATPKGPIAIDWPLMLEHELPPEEVDFVGSSSPTTQPSPSATQSDYEDTPSGGEGDAADFERFTDHELRERIKRFRRIQRGVKLPDGGEKVRRCVHRMEKELDRRRVAMEKKGDKSWKPSVQSNSKNDPYADGGAELESNSSARKYQLKSTASMKNYSQVTGAAFSKQLSVLSHDKRTSLKKGVQRALVDETYPRKLGSRSSMSHQLKTRAVCVKVNDHKLCLHIEDDISDNRRKFGLKTYSCIGRISDSSIKRRRLSKHHSSSYFEFKKEDVVLLDDEDVEPAKSVDGEMADKWDESKIYYPSRSDPGAVELTYSDMNCLEPEVYLKSPVINFYIQYLKKSIPHEGLYIFNTYFYSKLEEALSTMGGHDSQFSKLRRWWKGVDIFKKAYIILPIHGKMHWSLIIICMPGKETESGPMILHLDSLGLHSSIELFDTIESYLGAEWCYMQQDASYDISFSESIWNRLSKTIHRKKVEVPRQQNEYDCGIFMLYYIERFIREAPDRMTKEGLCVFGRKWFNPQEASGLRARIRAILSEVFESARLDVGPSHSESLDDDHSEGEDKDGDIIMTVMVESSDE